jgi:TolB-like protein
MGFVCSGSRQALNAVLPFANMSSDPEQKYFADAMVEEAIGIPPHLQ